MISADHPRFSCTSDMSLTIYGKIFSGPLVHTNDPSGTVLLRKTIEGYGFCFDFIPKGIIFSTQIINRYVAEPSLCKDSIKFLRCLEALLADLQK